MSAMTILAPKGGPIEEKFRAITNESGILSVVEIFRSNEVVQPLANFQKAIVVRLARRRSWNRIVAGDLRAVLHT